MRTFLRGKVRLLFIAFAVVLAVPAVALASDLTGSVVDTTAPTGSVTLSPGNSGNIQINWSVTGKQDGTSTFKVYRDWTLSGGTFTGSNPETVTVAPRPVANAPATTGTVDGTVSVGSGQAASTTPFPLTVSAFDITNSVNTAKLEAGTFSTYNVTVQGVTDPCAGVTNPEAPVITGTPDTPNGSSGWYTSVPSVSASSATSGATIEYATKSLPGGTKSGYSPTPPVLTDGTTEVFAKATSATCNRVSESSRVFMVDTIDPEVLPADVNDTTWRNTSLTQGFTSSDNGSGLADSANDASFSLTAANQSADASNPTVASRTVYDVAGNSTTRTVSALIDLTKPVITDDSANNAPTGTTLNDSGWYTSPVTNTFKASDGLSGFVSPLTDPYTFPKSSGATEEGPAVKINSGSVSDKAGNAADAKDSQAFKIDLNDPTVNITGPADGAKVDLCASGIPSPSFTASDTALGSGVNTSSGGFTAQPNTATGVGNYAYAAQATDVAGRQGSATRNYSVVYGASAFSGPLQPINNTSTGAVRSSFKLGSTIPVKFQLRCGTTPINNAVAQLWVSQQDTKPETAVNETASTNSPDIGNQFRVTDTATGTYQFNLSTKSPFLNPKASQPTQFALGTWYLYVSLDDGSKFQIAQVDFNK